MFLHKKALYNLIQFNLQEPEAPLKPWQQLDFRQLGTEILFQNLNQICSAVDSPKHFEEIANTFESPEEMSEAFVKKAKPKEPDHFFLIIFELWRRLLPEKRTVSTFCDELDCQIMRHENAEECQQMQDTLEYFKQILDDNTDAGNNPLDVFNTLQSFCCNNLEAFLYDYILEQIDEGEIDYAGELLEDFYPYVPDPTWFDYLVARLEMVVELEVGFKRLESVIKKITDVDLAIEVLSYLSQIKNPHFEPLAKRTLKLLKAEEDFIEFLSCCAHYYESQEIQDLLETREEKACGTPLDLKDPDFIAIKKIISL